jgi:hypothetical protein
VFSKCKQELHVQITSILKDSNQILLNFKPRSFSEFSFKIHFEFEEVSMEKVAPSLQTLQVHILFENFQERKVHILIESFQTHLNYFE